MATQAVQVFGKKKNATGKQNFPSFGRQKINQNDGEDGIANSYFAAAVARCVAGKGLIRVNGTPLKLFAPEILRAKLYEPILLLGTDKFADVDIRVKVTGGGHVSRVYAVRQAVRFCHDKNEIRIHWTYLLTRFLDRLPRLSLVTPEASGARRDANGPKMADTKYPVI